MSAIPYDRPTPDFDIPDAEQLGPPGRPRRRWLNRRSAALAAVITCAAGFYAGVRVEKSQLNSTSATTIATAAGTGTNAAGAAGGRAGFLGGGTTGANASIGTVSSVDGNTIYLTGTSGNTVKVTLSSATKITKSQSVSANSIRPGDTIVVQGVKGSSGTITATSVNDSGASAAQTGAGATSSASNPTNAGTAG
jgi:Domain of unknown function (DUF5666)